MCDPMRRLIISFCLCFGLNQAHAMAHKVDFEKAVDQAIARYGVKTEPELISFFSKAKVAYPPNDVALLAFKKEQQVQLWAKNKNQSWRHIHTYPLTASSGRLGPKLKERDRQIPEGIYRLTSFNPFSAWHLSMMINYPNNFDRLQASKDGRNKLGGNIFLHGKATSVGCLAVGDKAIDQLFFLTHRVGLNHVQLIIAPNDLRRAKPATSSFAQPRWLPELYSNIQQALTPFSLSNTVG
jgi:murein L,D-transpeptidase YafK